MVATCTAPSDDGAPNPPPGDNGDDDGRSNSGSPPTRRIDVVRAPSTSTDSPRTYTASVERHLPSIGQIQTFSVEPDGNFTGTLLLNGTTGREKWESLGLFVKYGMISEEKFYEKAKDFALLGNTKDEYATLEEYKEKGNLPSK